MNLSVLPISPIRERNRDEPTLEVRKPIDNKVRGLVLEMIGTAKGGLLPSATAPQIVTFLLTGAESGKMVKDEKRKKRSLRKSPIARKVPIGLEPVDEEGWVNALMQFIVYVPGLAESFHFAPRSLYPIREFIEQYHQDIQDGKAVSNAGGPALYRLFAFKFPHLSLLEIFETFLHLLRPKWELFRGAIDALKNAKTTDFFLICPSIKKQIFAEPNGYYDLTAFIEKRPDGAKVNYITYIKLDGSWYQCEDERITHLRSDLLLTVLQRSILSHYKKVF